MDQVEKRVEAEVRKRVEVIINSEVVQQQVAAKMEEERAKMQKEVCPARGCDRMFEALRDVKLSVCSF